MTDSLVTDLRADAELRAGRIAVSWSATWPQSAERPRWWLVRRPRAYPTTRKQGVLVVDTGSDDLAPGVVDEQPDLDRGEWRARYTVLDSGLDGGVVYYYVLFDRRRPRLRAAAMATGRHGLGGRLYELLPAIHRSLDEPAPAIHRSLDEPAPGERDGGALRRFLEVPGAALDQVLSLAEALGGRHDVAQVRADLLPYLARWIGWDLDRTLDVMAQRQEILFAPELFRTVGTAPNLRAQVNRLTGWDCRVKDMVHNVFLSNAPERLRRWEIWSAKWDGEAWGEPQRQIRSDGFEGRPAAVSTGGGGWLFWHRDRGGRREIWLRSLEQGRVAPYPAVLDGGADPAARLAWSDESPAAVTAGDRLWLFWSSDRDGAWDVWGAWDDAGNDGARPFEQGPQEEPPSTTARRPANLTSHPGGDRSPAAVADRQGRIWLFWQSARRGPTDIWCRVHDGDDDNANGGWDENPRRVTRAERRHEMPAAAIDDEGRIWLVFCDDLGDRRNLSVVVCDGGEGAGPQALTSGPWRDEAPGAVCRGGRMWIFWHSNRSGRWQILGRPWGWAGGAAEAQGERLEVASGAAADQEPAAVADGPGLRLFWRSQRRGSCTVDFDDEEMVARIRARSSDDWARYTYEPGGRYAREAVGVYVTAGAGSAEVIDRQRARIQAVLARELPLNVRAVLVVEPAPYVAETYSGLLDSHRDRMLGWTWLHSWKEGLYEDHRTVDFAPHPLPVSTRYRTWHAGVLSGD